MKLNMTPVFKRILFAELLLSLLFLLLFPPKNAYASYVNTNLNTFVHDATELQVGYPGQDMSFKVRIGYNNVNGLNNPKTDSITNVIVRLSNDQNYLRQDEDPGASQKEKNPYDKEEEADQYQAWRDGQKAGIDRVYGGNLTYPIDSGKYPFEVNASTFTQEERFDTLRAGEYHEVSFNITVRADTKEGYYGIPVSFYYNVPPNSYPDYKGPMKVEYINVYIKGAKEIANPASLTNDKAFAVGEGQDTPAGNAPAVMEYGVNFRNQMSVPLYQIKVHINTALAEGTALQPTERAKSEAVTGFPFRINEVNYDRCFDAVQPNETITATYSMAIMQNAASGFYPISYTVSYKLTPDASASYEEKYTSYVCISNPAMRDDSDKLGEFNQNDRKKARIILDSFRTEPEQVFAGQPFTLHLSLKNASADISASNILFSLESEKVENSSVFSTDGGTSSFVVNSLRAGETSVLELVLTPAPGLDPRSYVLTINEKFDSPDFKNAEEKITVDIPVNQQARLSVSNFELTPSAIEVGRESNIMFGINNTGRVVLYNVQVIFEADSIKRTTFYAGNIKPGETKDVDVMLIGAAPTMDDGTIPITIQYEDVNGQLSSLEQSCSLTVTEPAPDMSEEMEDMQMPQTPAGPGKILPFAAAAAVAAIAAAAVMLRRKKRHSNTEDED